MRPIQPKTCEVHELDLLPETKAMQATFEPVMIQSYNEKQGDEGEENPIAGLIPSHFIEDDRTDRSDDEQDETPTCQCGARRGGQGDRPIEFCDEACQYMGFRHGRYRLVLEHRADLTGRGRVRQL